MESEMWKIALEQLEDVTSDIDTSWIKKRQRKINTKKLITCVINSLHRKVSLKCCLCTIDGCNFTFAAYQRALLRCPVEVFRQLYNQLTQSNKSRRNRILAVDSSKIEMSKSQHGPHRLHGHNPPKFKPHTHAVKLPSLSASHMQSLLPTSHLVGSACYKVHGK